MSKREKAMKLALTLYRCADQLEDHSKDAWGMKFFTVHIPGKILRFNSIKEIRSMARKVTLEGTKHV